VIVGAVHIPQALAHWHSRGYRVRVIDRARPNATEERFPRRHLGNKSADEALARARSPPAARWWRWP